MPEDVTQTVDRISAVVDAAPRDRETVERTLTDGYAQALVLETERCRIEKRLAAVAQTLAGGGNTSTKARELTELAARLEGNAGDLTRLRAVLADLRRHADDLRA